MVKLPPEENDLKIKEEEQITTQEKLIKRKLSLLELAEFLQNISQACRINGCSRQHFKEQDPDEIETEHPGYLLAQDTFYVVYLKGVGRIYQPTVLDAYSSRVFAKLYTAKVPITAADTANDRVLPFFEEQGVPILRILTDRGTEFCGALDKHPYEIYLPYNEMEHTKTRAGRPQSNGMWEVFHKTVLNEFYRVTFRRKVYGEIEELQKEVDEWVKGYNNRCTHQGKRCQGKTPMETFTDGLNLVKEKNLDNNFEGVSNTCQMKW